MITELLHRRRLLFWLIRAYIKKRKRTIISFFLAGIGVGILVYVFRFLFVPFLPQPTTTIGVVGSSYTIDSLPVDIQNKMSLGLTRLTDSGSATPSAAASYEVSSDGKKYTFHLREGLYWQDGKRVEAKDINYNFKDVTTQISDNRTIIFTLKEPHAPFPTVVSQPLFRKGLIGIVGTRDLAGFGAYKIIDVNLNGSVVSQLTLEHNITKEKILYKFYNNEEEAKMHFMLGDVSSITNLISPGELAKWKNITISKTIAYNQLVTLFYNTSIPSLSDKTTRQALTYALPYNFPQEQRALSPLSPNSWAYSKQEKYAENLETAKKLLGTTKDASHSSTIKLTITTTARFQGLANHIKENWAKIGVEADVAVVGTIPQDPQVLLERYKIPSDPDQYILWHSTQNTNITHFASPKIDKLLEDGRQTTNQEDRAQIYDAFQLYLVDEAPAAFLYYPEVYTVSRKQ